MHEETRTRRIGSKRFVVAVSTLTAALLSGCAATKIEQPIVGYACCNLRLQDGWVSSNNVQTQSFVPIGEPIRLTTIKKKYYVYGHVGAGELAFRDDHAVTEEDTMRWLRQVIVAEDPRPLVDAWPQDTRQAVRQGKVAVGMTRDQVRMSLGPPGRTDTPDLGAKAWKYWTFLQDLPVEVIFDDQGRVETLRGVSSAVRSIEYQP